MAPDALVSTREDELAIRDLAFRYARMVDRRDWTEIPRVFTPDCELSGEKIHEGERIILGIASGNRDEQVYARAGEFWLERGWPNAPEHLTFGPGPHLCLGNQLARMEARVVIEQVIAACAPGALRLAPGYARHEVPMFLEYGPERLDVVIES